MSRRSDGFGRPARLGAFFALALLWLAVPRAAGSAASVDKDKEKPYALLAVSVFTADGFALAGVPVSVKRKDERKPKWQGRTDRRGELVVRLPAGRGTYEVTTESKDHEKQTQTVEVYGEERVETIFRLTPRRDSREE